MNRRSYYVAKGQGHSMSQLQRHYQPSLFSNGSSPESIEQNETIFHMMPHCVRGGRGESFSAGFGQLTKMAAVSICGKGPIKICFS